MAKKFSWLVLVNTLGQLVLHSSTAECSYISWQYAYLAVAKFQWWPKAHMHY